MLNQETILRDFPNIKLSYENLVYKKVYHSDIILAIPEGKKCFVWFTSYNDKNVCFIMEINKNKKIENIKITNACFSNELSYGTILYGTVFYQKHNHFFAIEDIFYFKGKEYDRECWGNKFTILNKLLTDDLKQVSYNNSFIVFGLPIFSNNINDLINKINSISYNINCIQFRLFHGVNNYLITPYKNIMCVSENEHINNKTTVSPIKNDKLMEKQFVKTKELLPTLKTRNILKSEIVFKIKPDIQNDIYHLYCLDNNSKEEFYSIAHIPDYKTSVFMNNLFRNIKENTNLDALEESDDEEEFENEKEDKFVHLEKEYNINCIYNFKFKKWTPIKLADPKFKIVSLKELPYIDKK
jgi:hypothetical protein